jgi:hypothetical protein
MLPVFAACGSTKIVYVPVLGNVCVSMNGASEYSEVGPTRFVPSGFWIDTFTVPLPPVPNFQLDEFSETRWPAVPWKVSAPFCPGTVVVTVWESPAALGVVEPEKSAATR